MNACHSFNRYLSNLTKISIEEIQLWVSDYQISSEQLDKLIVAHFQYSLENTGDSPLTNMIRYHIKPSQDMFTDAAFIVISHLSSEYSLNIDSMTERFLKKVKEVAFRLMAILASRFNQQKEVQFLESLVVTA
ncbi:hypothetical protein N9R79_03925 [Vibrio sp.]|nr:hypothetical protein [Vibrio sp.]